MRRLNKVNLSGVGCIAEVNIDSPEERYTIAKFDLLKLHSKTLSPIIFTKAKPVKNSDTAAGQRLYVFENLLSVVVQAYYKSSYAIETVFPEPVSTQTNTINHKSKKSKDRRNKAIQKLHRTESKGENRQDRLTKEEIVDSSLVENNGILDYLVSPLKFDFEFGQLIRELVHKTSSDL